MLKLRSSVPLFVLLLMKSVCNSTKGDTCVRRDPQAGIYSTT